MTDSREKEKQQEHLREFEHYFPAHDRNDNVIKEIEKDLKELNKISDVNKQYEESGLILRKHIYSEGYAEFHWDEGKLYELEIDTSWEETLGKYKKMIDEIRKIHFEALEILKKAQCHLCQKQITTPHFYLKNTEYEKVFCSQFCLNIYLVPCDECKKSRYGVNWQRTDQDDGKRFCSKECFNKYYALNCNLCQQKCLTNIYYNNPANQTGTICSSCYQKRQKKAEQKAKFNSPTHTHRERERERQHSNKNNCPQCHKQLTNPTNYQNLYQSYKLLAEYLAEKGKIKINHFQEFCSDNCFVENSGMNEILLNFTPQEHEDFVEWKKRREHNARLANNYSKNNSMSNDKNLLKEKGEELKNLENQLKENKLSNEEKNNSKIIIWIGGSLLGVGLVGLVIYLILRKENK